MRKTVRVTDAKRPESFDSADSDPIPDPMAADAESAAAVLKFWEAARGRAGVLGVEAVTGMGVAASVPPPAWAFGDNPALADQLLDLVLAGTKTATSSLAAEYDDTEPMPKAGDLSILLDGAGTPRALIRTTSVEVVPFGDVDEDFAAAEGEDDRTLASWRAEHEKFWSRAVPGISLGPGTEVVCERFEVLYPQG